MTSDHEAIHALEQQRREKMHSAAALGHPVYGGRTDGLVPLCEARRLYDEAADLDHRARGKEAGFEDKRPVVRVAGRVVLHRDNGKLVWMNLRDAGLDLQIAISQRDCDEAGFGLAKLTDLGDIVVAEGPLAKTKTGEITVWATSLRPGAKSLLPPPEKHAGLQDMELRYRQRYVDMWSNPESTRVLLTRSRIMSRTRRFLDGRGFVEVETPMLQSLAGGAAAKPFVTHLNAMDIDVYLRVAPELYLKRLMVGGIGKVYEVNRNFRNEGVDKQHNPEFTSLEVYEAFGDCMTMLELTESLIRELATMVRLMVEDERGDGGDEGALPDSVVMPFGDLEIDYARAFDRITYAELFERALGFSLRDHERVWADAEKRGLLGKIGAHLAREGRAPAQADLRGKVDDVFVVNELFEQVAEPTLDPARPTFVLEYPSSLSPLTRPKADDPTTAERWDLFIGGMEIGPGYTELNDPDIQAAKFREQLAGIDDEESTFRTYDEDFVNALKVGMPPAGGMGVGMDRLVMLLTNQRSIRDVIPFPFMRPV